MEGVISGGALVYTLRSTSTDTLVFSLRKTPGTLHFGQGLLGDTHLHQKMDCASGTQLLNSI